MFEWENKVFLAGRWVTWRELADAAPAHPVAADLAFVVSDISGEFVNKTSFARLAAAIKTGGCALLIIGEDRMSDDLADTIVDAGFSINHEDSINDEDKDAPAIKEGEALTRITVLSSGTTGRPKLIPHTAASLATMRGVRTNAERTWLVPYADGTYAWYQCALMSLTVSQQHLAPISASEVQWIGTAKEAGVDAISATPTFWRRSFFTYSDDDLQSINLRQISLGGEPVDQPLLDALARLYPAARITHIYASSEAGACVVVSDVREGFPQEWLVSTDSDIGTGNPGADTGSTPNRAQLAIRDNSLWVLSPWSHTDLPPDWFDTGDFVEIRDGRVVIVGRTEGRMVNVGGAKVDCGDVEKVLLKNEHIAWCRVSPRRAPLVGEVVAAEIVLRKGGHCDASAVRDWCAKRLPEVAVPRSIKMLDEIPVSNSLKTSIEKSRSRK